MYLRVSKNIFIVSLYFPQSTVDSVSVWTQFDFSHGVGNQRMVQFSEYFPAFGRRLRLLLLRRVDTNELDLCLLIDPAEAISAVPTTFSFSADAYNPQSPLIPAATAEFPDVSNVYGNVAPAATSWAHTLSEFAGPVNPISHRAKFPSDQMVVHYIIKKY